MGKVLGGLALLATVAVGAFMAGRASVRVDDQDLRDSLAVYRHASRVNAKTRDSLVAVILTARDQVVEAEAAAARADNRARQRERNAAVFGARADSLERLLAAAQTPADSIPILIAACTERRLECAELRTANADLHEAIVKDSLAKAGLREEIAAHLQTRTADSTRLVQADRLIGQLEKAGRGCRVRFIGAPCPVAIGNYNVTRKEFSAGAGIPLKPWLTFTLTWTP